MKKFIYKVSIFSLLSLSIIGIFYLYLFNQPKTNVKISKKNIIIGDSNTRWAMDDNILKSYANYSTGGEMYISIHIILSTIDGGKMEMVVL